MLESTSFLTQTHKLHKYIMKPSNYSRPSSSRLLFAKAPINSKISVVLLLLLLLVAAPALWAQETPAVVQAWETASAIGRYDFTTTIHQTTQALPKLLNAGLSPTTESLYIEGTTDRANEALTLKLWSQGGGTLLANGAVEMQVTDGIALGRVEGSEWEAVDDISTLFAPNQDPLGYLNAAGAMTTLGSQRDATGMLATRYQFEIDGPSYARFMRDQLQSELRQRNELPAGIQLGVSQQLAEMEATGEIWLGEDGLPLRQVINVTFAASGLERVSAEITTDFSNWGDEPVKTTALIGLRDWGLHVRDAAPTIATNLSVVTAAGLFAFVIVARADDRRVYRAIAYGFVFLFLASPILQAGQASAFGKTVKAFEAEHGTDEAAESDSTLLTPDYSAPPASRVAQTTNTNAAPFVDNGVDSDGDGLTDAVELNLSLTLPNVADSDGDGLSDGVEVHELGTNPNSADTDGDTLTDIAETQGFSYAANIWYPDPLKFDSNGDGNSDSFGCTETAGALTCADTNGNGTPDVYDLDDDGDGVPDKVDSASSTYVGDLTNGLQNQTLHFDVDGLLSGQTAMVDFQLRPIDADHLWYSLSILDWPTNDRNGQITRVFDDAFGNSGREANGDMRLTPLLEIEMSGASTPLPLTNPQTRLTFAGDVNGTTTFLQTGADVAVNLNLTAGAQYDVSVHPHDCTTLADGNTTTTFTASNVAPTAALTWANISLASDVALGNRAIRITDTTNNKSICRHIPNIVNGPHANQMIDADALDVFGVSVRETDSGGIYAYVPLTLLYDETENVPTAFTGRMFYDPTTNDFGAEQKARLLWTVNVKTDRCKPMPDSYDPNPATVGEQDESVSDKVKAWCAVDGNWMANGTTVVHAYADDWYLTGMSVQRNIAYKTAAVYQDPSYTSAQAGFTQAGFSEDALWMLAQGLDVSFMAGRGTAGVRNMTIDTVAARWDNRSNGAASDQDRFNLPANAFMVERHDYRDEIGLADLAQQKAYNILQTHFTPQVASGVQDTTILYLQENSIRKVTIGQDAITTIVDNRVAINAADSTTNAPLTTVASLNWAPYRYVGGNWQPYPIEAYWVEKGAAIETALVGIMGATDAPAAGFLARTFYFGLATGYAQFVEVNTQPANLAARVSDAEMLDYLHEGAVDLSIGKGTHKAAQKLLKIIRLSLGNNSVLGDYGGFVNLGNFGNKLLETYGKELSWADLLAPRGQTLLKNVSKVGARVDNLSFGGLVFAVAATAVSVISAAVSIVDAETGRLISIVASALAVIATSLSLITTVLKSAAMLAVKTLKSLLSEVGKIKGAVIFAVIGAVISVGFFIYKAVAQNLAPGSLALNQAFAELVAGLAVTILLIAIGSIPVVGQIITAIIFLIDSIIGLICSVVPKDPNGGDAKAREYGCAGIGGLLGKVIVWFIYDNAPLIELDRDDRLNVTNLDYDFVDPAVGFQAGNRLRVSADIDTALFHNNIDDIEEFSFFIGYRWMFNPTNEKQSVLTYQFAESKQPVHANLQLGTQTNDWLPPAGGPAAFANATAYRRESLNYTMNAPLVANVAQFENEGIDLYIAEGQAFYTQECTYPYLCWLKETRNTVHIDVGALTNFDVFPATVSEFRATTFDTNSNAYRLAWDDSFPFLKDADGDGLRAVAFGGTDPNDGNPDSDGDGLSDFYELATTNTDPLLADTDGDGLCDGQEGDFLTDPTRADTDSDGLLDGEEVFHLDSCDVDNDNDTTEWAGGWEFVYAFNGTTAQSTRVQSDPLSADADGDLYLDSLERTYGFNPNVPSTGDILQIKATVDKAIVKPGDTIQYDVELTNKLNSSVALGLHDVSFDTNVQSDTLFPRAFNLQPLQSEQSAGTVTIRSDLTQSAVVSMTNHAGAIITNPQNQSNARSLWLPFDAFVEIVGNDGYHAEASGNNYRVQCNYQQFRCGSINPPTEYIGGFSGGYLSMWGGHSTLFTANASATDLGITQSGFTVETWVTSFQPRDNNPQIEQTLLRLGDIRITLTNTTVRVKEGNTVLLQAPFNSTYTSHFAWRYERGKSALFVDGHKIAEGPTDLAASLTTFGGNSLFIGEGSRAALDTNYRISLDEFSIYPYGRADGDIAAVSRVRVFYLSGTNDIADGATVPDQSGLGNLVRCIHPDDYANEGGSCPDLTAGFVNNGFRASPTFGRTSFFQALPNLPLDLSRHGEFTMAAWVSQSNGGDGTPWLLGASSDTAGSFLYPSMYTSAFVESTGATSQQFVVDFQIGIRGNDDRTCTMRVDTFVPDSDPRYGALTAAEEWYHFSATFNGTRFRAYINGIEMPVSHQVNFTPTADCNGVTPRAAYSFIIGGEGEVRQETYSDGHTYPEFYGEGFDGAFDELQIFNYELSAEQIDDIYWNDTPVLDLRLDEAPTSSTFKDRSINNFSATCTGGGCPLAGLPGRDNQAVRFDGANNVLQLPTMGNLGMINSDFTLAGWVKPEVVNSVGLFKSADNKLFLGTRSADGKPIAILDGTAVVAPTALQPNRWVHLALRFDYDSSGSTMTLFVDGVPVGSLGNISPSFTASNLFTGPGQTSVTKGMMDRLQVFRNALANSEIVTLMTQVPVLNLHMNEPFGTVYLENSADPSQTVTCLDCNLGIQGRMYGATNNSRIEINPSQEHDSNVYSVGAWLRPTQQQSQYVPIIVKSTEHQVDRHFGLYQVANSMKLHASMQLADCSSFVTFDGVGSMTENVWNHVMLTYDGATLKLYLNGSLDASASVPSICAATGRQIHLGRIGGGGQRFVGDMDEMLLYTSVLSADEIRELYHYQLAWYDAEVETRITVDADRPTVKVDVPTGYVTNEDRIVAIIANDATSDITQVRYQVVKIVNGDFIVVVPFTPASADGEVWLFNFQPDGSGTYVINSEAVDSAGNSALGNSVAFYVDDAGPLIEPFNVEGVAAVPVKFNHSSATWDVDLAGGIMTELAPLDRVEVRVVDALGSSQAGWQITTHTLDSWQFDYPFDIRPNGSYSVTLNAWDAAGNQSTRTALITIDGTPPDSSLTVNGGGSGEIQTDTVIQGTLVETGTVKSGVAGLDVAFHPISTVGDSGVVYLPTGVVAHFQLDEVAETGSPTFADSSPSELTASCTNCPTSNTGGRIGGAATFDGVDDTLSIANANGVFADGAISFGAWVKPTGAIQSEGDFLTLNSSAIDIGLGFKRTLASNRFTVNTSTDGSSSTVNDHTPHEWHFVMAVIDSDSLQLYVDGVVVLTVPLSTLPASVSTLVLGGTTFVGQIDDVVVYNRALTMAEVRTLTHTGTPALHLRFDEIAIDSSNTIRDSSHNDLTVTSSGLTLQPVAGAVGAAAIEFGNSGKLSMAGRSLDLSDGQFTQMAWVYPQGDGFVFSGQGALATYPFWHVTNGTDLFVGFTSDLLSLGYNANGILTADQWNFVATTFDGTTYRIYVNGVVVASTGDFANQTPVEAPGTVEIGALFTGRLDDVQIIRQVVSADFISAEYAKGWQAATTSSTRADSTDWSYSTPDLPAGAYEIRLRSHDINGNYSFDHRELPRWEGLINDADMTSVALAQSSASSGGILSYVWLLCLVLTIVTGALTLYRRTDVARRKRLHI